MEALFKKGGADFNVRETSHKSGADQCFLEISLQLRAGIFKFLDVLISDPYYAYSCTGEISTTKWGDS